MRKGDIKADGSTAHYGKSWVSTRVFIVRLAYMVEKYLMHDYTVYIYWVARVMDQQ
jgi:hypothetical protein